MSVPKRPSLAYELTLLGAKGIRGLYDATGINVVELAFRGIRAANRTSKAVNRVLTAAMHKGQM